MVQYQAEFKPEGDVIVVTFPDVGYGATQGATETEALEMAEDFLVMAMSDLIKQGKDIPKATTRRARKYRWIKLPALASVKMELHRELKDSGVRKAELARRLRISRGNVDRLFDLHRSTRLELLEAAFAVLGRRLSIGVEKAADGMRAARKRAMSAVPHPLFSRKTRPTRRETLKYTIQTNGKARDKVSRDRATGKQ
jgi:antitoxin HicB